MYWIADGPNVRDFGVLFTTRMIVVKLADGAVWVDSPVPVAFATLKRIAELGPVRYLVATTCLAAGRVAHALSRRTALGAANNPLHLYRRGGCPALVGWAIRHIMVGRATLINLPSKATRIRLSFTNRTLARRSLERLLSWDFDKLIIAHGPCIENDAKPFVERAFRWLTS